MMIRIGISALMIAAHLSIPVSAAGIEVFFTDFETGVPSAFSSLATSSDANVGNYHGSFLTTGSTTLTVSALPSHSELMLEFDLYLFNTWDGNDTTFGPDFFSLSGDITGSWTFTNHQPEGQSYPGTPDEIYGSGASSTHVYRGLDPTGLADGFLVSHTADSFTVTFGGPTTQTDEQWGIDNVRVSIIPEPATLGLLGLLCVAGAMRPRKRL